MKIYAEPTLFSKISGDKGEIQNYRKRNMVYFKVSLLVVKKCTFFEMYMSCGIEGVAENPVNIMGKQEDYSCSIHPKFYSKIINFSYFKV